MSSTGAGFLRTKVWAMAGSFGGNHALHLSWSTALQSCANAFWSRLPSREAFDLCMKSSRTTSAMPNDAPMGSRSRFSTALFTSARDSAARPSAALQKTLSACRCMLSGVASIPKSHLFGSTPPLGETAMGGVPGRAPWQFASCSPPPLEVAHLLQQVSNGLMPLVMPGWTCLPQPNLHMGLSLLKRLVSEQQSPGLGAGAAPIFRRFRSTMAGRIHLVPALEATFTAPAGME
mmetsp:Transcript_60722/g.195642  ORF Transcript_60722/g.195642 Transcript_60722/m.195642 type:complete len:233 (+) Transcript_60722:1640-2338(+)